MKFDLVSISEQETKRLGKDLAAILSGGDVVALDGDHGAGKTVFTKGVALGHHGIVNFCHWYVKEFRMTADDRSLAFSNFGFDAHMMDLYPALSCGASVWIVESGMRMDLDRMNRYMEENGVNISFLTTQVGHFFASSIENHSLRLLSVSGEKLMPVRKPP